MTDAGVASGGWTFLTNHSHVLISLARDPDLRLRDLAELVGITERAVQTILRDLEVGGYISRRRVGRRNRYDVHPELPMRHPVEAGHLVAEMLQVLVDPGDVHTASAMSRRRGEVEGLSASDRRTEPDGPDDPDHADDPDGSGDSG